MDANGINVHEGVQRELNMPNGSSHRGTPKPTHSQIKKLPNTALNNEDFYTLMNRDTEKEIMKQSKSPYEQKNFIKEKQLKKEKQRKNPYNN